MNSSTKYVVSYTTTNHMKRAGSVHPAEN